MNSAKKSTVYLDLFVRLLQCFQLIELFFRIDKSTVNLVDHLKRNQRTIANIPFNFRYDPCEAKRYQTVQKTVTAQKINNDSTNVNKLCCSNLDSS